MLQSKQLINSGPPWIGVAFDDYGDTDWAGRALDLFDCNAMKQRIQMNTYEHRFATIEEKRSTMAHEFGHALGLTHPVVQREDTPCVDVSLMNHYWAPRSECGVYIPQHDDRAGIDVIYNGQPGCDDCAPPDVYRTPAPSANAVGSVLELTEHYDSLQELRADATDEVVVEATGNSRVEYMGGGAQYAAWDEPTPFLVTEVRVLASAQGDAKPGQTLWIRQFGDQDEYAVNGAAAQLEPGNRYLLFTKPWVTASDANTEQHVLVGAQAAWRLESSTAVTRSATGTDGWLTSGESNLPTTVHVQVDTFGDLESAQVE
ncbi:hypothetical protein ACFWH7_03670 [Cellulosimicrobium cellulans]|uniref:hypothetical protein n=1 Tax=Cellulosimicrobium cellulans TaxID=1710 RepID=UPI00365EAB36